MFYAVTSDGKQYWLFLKGNNHTWVTAYWLIQLKQIILRDHPDFLDTHVIVHDNAPSHTSKAKKKIMNFLGFRVLWQSPGSFIAMSHDGAFGILKFKVSFID